MAKFAGKFNRIIDLKLLTAQGLVTGEIYCPRLGRKPDITIQGEFLPNNLLGNVEVHLHGVYMELNEMAKKIQITFGYAPNPSAILTGEILTQEIRKPGPDNEIVFTCKTGNFKDWTDAQIDISEKKGTALSKVLTSISTAINLNPPLIGASIAAKALQADFKYKGLAKEALNELSVRFPDVGFVPLPDTGNIKAYAINGIDENSTMENFNLDYLTCPPIFYGSVITIQTLCDALLYPGALIRLDELAIFSKGGNFFRKTKLSGTFRINAVKFEFATVQEINAMTLKGYKI